MVEPLITKQNSMATVINTPAGNTGEGGGGMGMIVGIVIVILVIVLLILFGLPALRGGSTTAPDVNAPSGGSDAGGGAQINLPEQLDVNVNPGSN